MKKRKLNSKNPKYLKKTSGVPDGYTEKRVLLQKDEKLTVYGVYLEKVKPKQ